MFIIAVILELILCNIFEIIVQHIIYLIFSNGIYKRNSGCPKSFLRRLHLRLPLPKDISRICPFRRSPQRHGAWDRKEVLLNPLKISKRFFLTPFLRNCRFFGVSPIVLLCGTGEKEKYPQSKEKLKQRQSDVVERFPPSSPAVPCNAAGHGRGRKGYVRYKQTNMMLFSTPPSLRALPLSHLR